MRKKSGKPKHDCSINTLSQLFFCCCPGSLPPKTQTKPKNISISAKHGQKLCFHISNDKVRSFPKTKAFPRLILGVVEGTCCKQPASRVKRSTVSGTCSKQQVNRVTVYQQKTAPTRTPRTIIPGKIYHSQTQVSSLGSPGEVPWVAGFEQAPKSALQQI